MSDEQFVSLFISECVSAGVFSQKDICEKALNKIKDCDAEIAKMDSVRVVKDNLIGVLKHFDHESTRNLRGNKINMFTEHVDETSLEFSELMNEICKLVEDDNKMYRAADIITIMGGFEHQTKIYFALKKLGERQIVERDTDNYVIPGKMWDTRLQ